MEVLLSFADAVKIVKRPEAVVLTWFREDGLVDKTGKPSKMSLERLLEWMDSKTEETGGYTSERLEVFVTQVMRALKCETQKDIDSKTMFEIITNAALAWPGKEDSTWFLLVFLSAHCLRRGIEKGEIQYD